MIVFLIICVTIVMWVQQWILENSPDFVDANFWPEENVVDPDDSFNIIVELKNKKSFPIYFIRVGMSFPDEFQVSPDMRLAAKSHVKNMQAISVSTWLKSNQTVKLKVPVSISARGRFYLPTPTLFFGDFLGLKEKQKRLENFREVVVAPKNYSTDEVNQVLGKFIGEYSVRRFIYEDPVLTIGFREYSGKEPMKMISWKQSAQKQRLMVKEYDHTIEPVLSVVLNIETMEKDAADQMEKAYSIARSVCSNLEAKGVSYAFFINAQMAGGSGEMSFVEDGIGSHHFGKIMERLGRGLHTNSMSCDRLLQFARKTSGSERGLIVITPDSTAVSYAGADGQILVLDACNF